MAKPFSYQNDQDREPSQTPIGNSAQNSAAFKTCRDMSCLKALSTVQVFLSYNEEEYREAPAWHLKYTHDRFPVLQPWHCSIYLLAQQHSLICGHILGRDFILITGFFFCFLKYKRWMTNDLPNKQYSKPKLRIMQIKHPVIILINTTCKYVP